MKMDHWKKLENMYRSAPCNQYFKPEIKVEEGRCEVRIPVREDLFHAAGALHGYVYFKAMDDSAFFAVNSLVEGFLVLTTNFTVYLIRPVTEGLLWAKGLVVSATKNTFIAESIVYNSDGKEVGRGSGTFMKSKIQLSEEMGYKL